jgi:hypothetical protein
MFGNRTTKRETIMPRGDKSSYTDKQKRQAEHIEEGYEHRGVGRKEAERRAWATVNKETGGGNKSGAGRGVPERVLETRRQDRRTARRQGFRKPSGRGAIALGEESGRDTQANRHGKVGNAQSRAEAIALRRPARPRQPPAWQNRRRIALSEARRSRHWAARG